MEQRKMPKKRGSSIPALVMLVALAGAAPACRPPAPAPGTAEIRPSYNADTGELELITYDRNRDGRVDAWLYMDAGHPTRVELDEDDDGAADRWEYYEAGRRGLPAVDAAGPVPQGILVRAEQDLRGDGRVSRWERYEDGRLTEVLEDTTGNGHPDKWEEWTDGALASIALDPSGTGRATRRIVYGVEGTSPRLESDEDGDGTFEPVRSTP
jgi:hypothetical protein